MPAFSLSVPIARDPDGVAKWWLDFPPVYEAKDGREQPYRIETISRTAERVEVRTFWKIMGMRRVFLETIEVVGPRAFDARIRMGRVDVFDTFRLSPDGRGGSLMEITTRMEGHGMMGRVMAPIMAPMLHRFMRRIWADAAELCAKDGRLEASRSRNA